MTTVKEAQDHIAALLQEIHDLNQYMDTNKGSMSLDDLVKAFDKRNAFNVALGQARKDETGARIEAGRGEREAAQGVIREAMGTPFKEALVEYLSRCTVVYTATRDESGDFATASVVSNIPQDVMDIFHQLVEDAELTDVPTAGRVIITVEPGKDTVVVIPPNTTVPRTTKAPGTPATPRAPTDARPGKGWARNGITLGMQAAFSEVATPTQLTEWEALTTNSAKDSYKRRVLKAAGFILQT